MAITKKLQASSFALTIVTLLWVCSCSLFQKGAEEPTNTEHQDFTGLQSQETTEDSSPPIAEEAITEPPEEEPEDLGTGPGELHIKTLASGKSVSAEVRILKAATEPVVVASGKSNKTFSVSAGIGSSISLYPSKDTQQPRSTPQSLKRGCFSEFRNGYIHWRFRLCRLFHRPAHQPRKYHLGSYYRLSSPGTERCRNIYLRRNL